MKNLTFYFVFFIDDDSDDGEEYAFGFNVNFRGSESYNDDVNSIEGFNEAFNEIEGKYGVHDWSTSPSDGVNAIGYTTYEVDDLTDMCSVMNEWRTFFLGAFQQSDVTPWAQLDIDTIRASDQDFYDAIEAEDK